MEPFKYQLKQRFDDIVAASDDTTIIELWKTSWKVGTRGLLLLLEILSLIASVVPL